MKNLFSIRLAIVFAVTLSLTSLSGPIIRDHGLPSIPAARAAPAPCPTTGASGACSDYWIPAGPAMNTELATIFTDETSEFIGLQSNPSTIDLTDWHLTPTLTGSLCPASQTAYYCSAAISEHGYFEIQFNLDVNYWGVDFQFGNSPAGVEIRQGIAHLIDRSKFASSDPYLAGSATAIDNPLPTSNGGLPSPNPCAWDSVFPESGNNCVVGAPGGTAYHLASAAGVNLPWQQALGSPDFCAAARHFVDAGLASGMNPTTCVLTGLSSGVTSNPVNIFYRQDDPPRLDLGQGIAQSICALFTGSYSTGCTDSTGKNILTVSFGPITAFIGFQTNKGSVNKGWGMYTAGYGMIYPFDTSLYFTYNSRFVSGFSGIQKPTGYCSPLSVPSFSALNYMTLCSPSYDNMSSIMEFAPCIAAAGDPLPGANSNLPTSPGNGLCPNTTQLSAISAGIQTEDLFGRGAFTIPIFETSDRFAYLTNWSSITNNEGSGVPNYFTWLNAYSPSPAQPGTVRQGFKQSTTSLNPYVASTEWDFFIVGNIYDSLGTVNPLQNSQYLDWMASSSQQLSNSALFYTPPQGTTSTFRFTLRNDLYWQDGRQVTSWDVKFSYMTLRNTGAFQGGVLAPVTGVTVINPLQFDVNVNQVGPFTKLSLTSPTIFPGRYWSVCGSSIWDEDVALGQVPDTCIAPDPNKITRSFDPEANQILIGSGPWMCRSSSGMVGGGCTPTGTQNPGPGSSYTLTRFGTGVSPGFGLSNAYFRSAGTLALYFWSGDTGDFTRDFLNFATVTGCFGVPPATLTTSPPSPQSCAHFQQGLGSPPVGTPPTYPNPVSLSQVGIVGRFTGLNWVSPFNWATSPPTGIVSPVGLVLHEGSATLNPASLAGCGSAYPSGGYDC